VRLAEVDDELRFMYQMRRSVDVLSATMRA
jgi:hypothetical protein